MMAETISQHIRFLAILQDLPEHREPLAYGRLSKGSCLLSLLSLQEHIYHSCSWPGRVWANLINCYLYRAAGAVGVLLRVPWECCECCGSAVDHSSQAAIVPCTTHVSLSIQLGSPEHQRKQHSDTFVGFR